LTFYLIFDEVTLSLFWVNFQHNHETFEKRSILFKIKEGDNFNHRHTMSISRIKIWAWRWYWAKGEVYQRSHHGTGI